MRIVKAGPNHIRGMHDIEVSSFSTPWSYDSILEDALRNKIALYLVATEKGEVLGYAGAWYFLSEAHITTLAVEEQSRNRGIAQRLLDELFKRLQARNVTAITLEVRESNAPARGLYRKLGFQEHGKRIKYYADTDEDAVIMWKTL
ncbi:MAG: ribosomal protein S18-alanine N-acetyltransferase [Clostridia bacterium]